MKLYQLLLITIALGASCQSRKQQPSTQQVMTEQTPNGPKRFVLPEIPPTLITTEGRADYLVRHYWDGVDFADTLYNKEEVLLEQAWVDYCDLLHYVPLGTAHAAMRDALQRMEMNTVLFGFMTQLADKYLYDPNSPMRNEEFYMPVLEVLIQSGRLSDVEKIRPRARLELAKRNRVGTKAMDFVYTLGNGQEKTLYETQGEYLLLYINNPGCEACATYLQELKDAPIVERMIEDGRLTVLAFYPDEDLAEWSRHRADFPRNWINSYDKQQIVEKENLYDLKAIPTLYLLDAEKFVLLKDEIPAVVEEYLLLN